MFTSTSSLKLVTASLFNITFFYFLLCLFFRHPASRWLRYTGCLLSSCLKESLSPPDLVSLWSVEQRGKKIECRTNKWRKNRPPVYEIQGKDQVKMNWKALSGKKFMLKTERIQSQSQKQPSCNISWFHFSFSLIPTSSLSLPPPINLHLSCCFELLMWLLEQTLSIL